MPLETHIKKAATLISQADGLFIGAGAGMGVDSGLPDFRGDQGLWRAYPRLGQKRLSFVDIANPNAFADNAGLAWGFYGHRLSLYRKTQPHEGFQILRRLAGRLPHGAFVFTSNVDGQFQKAGFAEETIAECHGSIHRLQCALPCTAATWPASWLEPDIDEENCQLLSEPPFCPECRGLARPNILMFNDWGWIPDQTENQMANLNRWCHKVNRMVVIELGAGVHVPTVRRVCESLKVPLIRINPAYPEVPKPDDVSLPLGALEALQRIEVGIQHLM